MNAVEFLGKNVPDQVALMTALHNEDGYRRVGAELRHRGMVVNSKKVRRLMRELDLQPKPSTVRGSPRPADCQNRRMKTVQLRGRTPERTSPLAPFIPWASTLAASKLI